MESDAASDARGFYVQSGLIELQLENACTRETSYTLRAPLLFKASVALKLQGLASQIFQALAERLRQHRTDVSRLAVTEGKAASQKRVERLRRIDKAINQLSNPKPGLVKEFDLMRQGAAVQTEHDNAAAGVCVFEQFS